MRRPSVSDRITLPSSPKFRSLGSVNPKVSWGGAVAATARVATLLYLSSLGSEPVVEAPAPPVEVTTSSDVLTAEVPGVSEALGWLVGGRAGG